MRVRRDISSIPLQSGSETWQRIIDLVTGPGSIDVRQLKEATGIMGSIIADEHPAVRAILFEGVGPQLRIYCRYGMNAIDAGGSVDALTWNPTAGDWSVHVPCDAENIDWVQAALSKTSSRMKVFDVNTSDRADEDTDREEKGAADELVVDWNIRR
jgi:hypothetical protein